MILKSDEGIFLGYSQNSIAYRVYNRRNEKVKEFQIVSQKLGTINIDGDNSQIKEEVYDLPLNNNDAIPLPKEWKYS